MSGYSNLPSKLTLTKRRKFLLVAFVLTTGLFSIQYFAVEQRYLLILVYGLISYLLSAWSLRSDLRGLAWLTDLILPTLYPVSVALFYFLLPQHEITRLIVGGLFLISMYALLLTANIFAVASIRTIQLLRAARAIGFLLTILTGAFLFHFIFSIHVVAPYIAVAILLSVFPLLLQGVWSYTLGERMLGKELSYTLVGTVITVEVAVVLSYWMIDVVLVSIFLSMVMYVVLGLMQHELEERLFAKTVQEYVGFAGLVFVIILITVYLRWMG